MTPQTILYIVLFISIVSYLFDQFLDYLNLKHYRKDLPAEVASFYDKEKYLKSIEYHWIQSKFSFITSAFSFVLSLAMLWLGGFGWLDQYLRPVIANEIVLALAFFATVAIVSDILTLPFQLYSTFVIEEKFGFNKTTVKTFILDKFKNLLLGALIGGILLTVMIYLVQHIGIPRNEIWFRICQ